MPISHGHDYKFPTEEMTALIWIRGPALHQSAMARICQQSLTACGPNGGEGPIPRMGNLLYWLVS